VYKGSVVGTEKEKSNTQLLLTSIDIPLNDFIDSFLVTI
jgi:hypothetical protein